MSQIDTDAVRKFIRTRYATANVWLRGAQVVRNGVWLGAEGKALLEEKVEAHIKWMRKHPKRVIEEEVV